MGKACQKGALLVLGTTRPQSRRGHARLNGGLHRRDQQDRRIRPCGVLHLVTLETRWGDQPMTASSWPFSTTTALANALLLIGKTGSIGNKRFPARNFQLEYQVSARRVASYAAVVRMAGGLADASAAFDELNVLHNRYLEKLIYTGTRVSKFDPTSADCPESFRTASHLDEFGHSEENLLLTRVEDIDFIARRTGVPRNELREMLSAAAVNNRNGDSDRPEVLSLVDILQSWHDSLDNRPVFAAYWEDTQSILADPKPGWTEEIRDRLGLFHYDPAWKPGREMDVVVFRYPVRLIPRFDRSSPRLLLRPTVLDGALSAAFCTAPPGTGVGSAVDLASRDDEPWQEVIHPPAEMKPDHVWAVDTLTSSPPADLARSRAMHIIKLCIRASQEFDDICNTVDGDLI
jgi:hypothetical protein